MAVWNDDYPTDELLANLIHTAMQTAKGCLGERMKASNGTFDEHNLCKSGEDGLHDISRVGFVKTHTSYDNLLSWLVTNGKRAGTIHYVSAGDGIGVYVIGNGGEVIKTGVTDHSLLNELLDPDCHSGLFLKDGGRAMQKPWHMASGKSCTGQAYGSNDDDALDPAHISQKWYTAHGADALRSRHVPDNSLQKAVLDTEESHGTNQLSCPSPDVNAYGFPSWHYGSSGSYGLLKVGISGGSPYMRISNEVGSWIIWYLYKFNGA